MRPIRVIQSVMLAATTLVAGCDIPVSGAVETAPAPLPRPPVEAAIPVAARSAASVQLADYYSRVQNGLLTQGLLRTDGGGPDVPFGSRDLVRNFIKIAFYEEYADAGGRLVARENASRMHRWSRPVSLSVEFGPSVGPKTRARDESTVSRLLTRIRRATGHTITSAPAGSGNFRVFVVSEDERRAMGPKLKAIMPGISSTALNTVVNLPQSTYCLVFATDPEQDGTYNQAIAVIRAEHPDLLRASCLHEEITQGFGLANDSPLARPSIFNDDEEFGLLTTHDEYLLKMLYDPRLRPGMSEAEARPIVERIAAELMGDESA